MGFITRGQGVSIHRCDCENYLSHMQHEQNEGRWVNVSWASEITDSYVTTIIILSKDRTGLVMDIATVLNSVNAKVRTLSARDNGSGNAITHVTLEVKNATELKNIMSKIRNIQGVSQVIRNGK